MRTRGRRRTPNPRGAAGRGRGSALVLDDEQGLAMPKPRGVSERKRRERGEERRDERSDERRERILHGSKRRPSHGSRRPSTREANLPGRGSRGRERHNAVRERTARKETTPRRRRRRLRLASRSFSRRGEATRCDDVYTSEAKRLVEASVTLVPVEYDTRPSAVQFAAIFFAGFSPRRPPTRVAYL